MKERKIRRHAFTFFVKRCRIHVIVRKSVMHVHGCCFTPWTLLLLLLLLLFLFIYLFLRCRCFLCDRSVNSLILTWIGGVRWFPHWRGGRVHDVQSPLFLLNHWLPRELGEGVDLPCHSSSSRSLCFPLLPSLQCFLFPFSFSPFILFSCHFLLFCRGGFILGFTCIIFLLFCLISQHLCVRLFSDVQCNKARCRSLPTAASSWYWGSEGVFAVARIFHLSKGRTVRRNCYSIWWSYPEIISWRRQSVKWVWRTLCLIRAN